MEQFILQDRTPLERVQMLEKMAAKTEKITYTRHLTDAEIEGESKKLADAVTQRARVEEDKRENMKMFNDRIGELKTKAEMISETLLSGTKEETRKCYKFVNLDTREVGYYNELGELVKTRPAMDQDMQLDMFGGDGKVPEENAALPGGETKALPQDNHPEAEDVDFEEVNE